MKKRVIKPLKIFLNLLKADEKKDMAQALGINPLYLYHVASGFRQAGAPLAIRIESATVGAVTRADIRPDIFLAD